MLLLVVELHQQGYCHSGTPPSKVDFPTLPLIDLTEVGPFCIPGRGCGVGLLTTPKARSPTGEPTSTPLTVTRSCPSPLAPLDLLQQLNHLLLIGHFCLPSRIPRPIILIRARLDERVAFLPRIAEGVDPHGIILGLQRAARASDGCPAGRVRSLKRPGLGTATSRSPPTLVVRPPRRRIGRRNGDGLGGGRCGSPGRGLRGRARPGHG